MGGSNKGQLHTSKQDDHQAANPCVKEREREKGDDLFMLHETFLPPLTLSQRNIFQRDKFFSLRTQQRSCSVVVLSSSREGGGG